MDPGTAVSWPGQSVLLMPVPKNVQASTYRSALNERDLVVFRRELLRASHAAHTLDSLFLACYASGSEQALDSVMRAMAEVSDPMEDSGE